MIRISATQWKLAAVLAGVVAVVIGVSGVLAERGLRARELQRIEESLRERAVLVRELASGVRFEGGARASLDALADRAGEAADARVTLIAADGTVVGDSHVLASRLERVESHADRPEVRAALRGRVGTEVRRSRTVGERLLYLAVPAARGGVVRVAVDLREIESAAADLRGVLLQGAAVGLALALALSFALSRLFLRPVERVRDVAASIARGDLSARLPWSSGGELGELGRAINRMAEQLRLRLDELAGETQQLQAVLNAMAEGVLVVDAAGKILLANARLRDLFGVSGAVEGRPPLEVVRSAELDELLARAARSSGPVAGHLVVPGAEPRVLRVQAVAFAGEGRSGTVAVFHDVTELVRIEKVRRDFVANASHELRTPLTAVRGFTETLLARASLSEAERRSYLEVVDRHAHRLTNLVDDLLELSRIESHEEPLEVERIDLVAVARTLIRDSRTRFEEKRLEVRFEGAGGAPVRADRRALEQILANLLDNAVKYTEPGGRIEVRIESDASWTRLRVSDTGVGIPERDLGRIFERFYRVDEARSRALGGTGLGLSIVKHLVQRLGGGISVDSRPGRGSTFTVRLPRADAAPDAAAPGAGESRAGGDAGG